MAAVLQLSPLASKIPPAIKPGNASQDLDIEMQRSAPCDRPVVQAVRFYQARVAKGGSRAACARYRRELRGFVGSSLS